MNFSCKHVRFRTTICEISSACIDEQKSYELSKSQDAKTKIKAKFCAEKSVFICTPFSFGWRLKNYIFAYQQFG